MNVFLHEIKSNRKSAIIWACSLSLLIIFYFSMFSSFTKDIALSKKLIGSLPQTVRDAFDIDLDTFFSILGFYSYLLTFIVLAGSIQAMNIGTGIISKEYRLKTADFLLTKPITRAKVMTSKLLAAFVTLLICDIVFVLAAFASAKAFVAETFSLQIFFMLSAILFFVQMIFFVLGVLFSLIFPRIKSVVSVTLPTVFVFFIIDMLGAVLGEEKVRYITPFNYFDSAYIMKNAAYEWQYFIIEIILLIVILVISYAIYIKKDIPAVS